MTDESLSDYVAALEQARAAGGVELELYRQPGFTGGLAVRRIDFGASGAGVEIALPDDDEPDL